MNTDERPIRIGVPARQAAERWGAESRSILRPEGEEAATLEVDQVDDRHWTWTVGETEAGRIEFRDAGEQTSEMVVFLERSEGSGPDRLRTIVNRFTEAVARPFDRIDPPVVADDPYQGQPPEGATDPDQPL